MYKFLDLKENPVLIIADLYLAIKYLQQKINNLEKCILVIDEPF